MPTKIDISEKGKTFHFETSSEDFIGKKVGDKVSGKFLKEQADLADYELEIAGASDKAGFPAVKGIPGTGLKKLLTTYGTGMKKRSKKEGKKKRSDYQPSGLKLRKTMHGEILDENIIQINLKVLKAGKKPLQDIFKKEEPKEETKEEKK